MTETEKNKISLYLIDEVERADNHEGDTDSEHSIDNTDGKQSSNEANYEESLLILAKMLHNNWQGISVYYEKDNILEWLKHVPPT